jgi:hypothetical protein
VPNSLGELIFLTGHQWFIGLNERRLDNNLSAVNTAPTTAAPNPLQTLTATASAGTGNITLTFTTSPLAADQRLAVWATQPDSPGTNPNLKQARLQGYSALAAVSPVDIASRWQLTQGLTMNLYVAVMDNDNGLLSAFIKARVTIGA